MASANAEAQCRSRRTNWHRTPPARDYARSNLSVWRTLRLAIGLPRIAFHIVVGVTIMACYFRFASRERRDRLIRWWSIGVLKIFGMQVRVAGPTQVLEPGSMLVMNHISWIDVYVIFAIQPVRFVAKAEIRGWPVIGSLCDGVGTLYIERGRRRAVHQTNQAIADLLNAGDRIGVFPEGTTSDGRSVLPFHANLIQAALAVNARIQPVALRYLDARGAVSDAPAYIGATTLWQSLCATLQGAPLVAEVELLKVIDTHGLTRHDVAQLAHDRIAARLGSGSTDTAPGSNADPPGTTR